MPESLAGLAYLTGRAGALFLRAVGWLLGLLHVRPAPTEPLRPTMAQPHYTPAPQTHGSGTIGLLATACGAIAAVGLAAALVLLALRRVQRASPAGNQVDEERETVASPRSAARRCTKRVRRRSRRRRPGSRRARQRARRWPQPAALRSRQTRRRR